MSIGQDDVPEFALFAGGYFHQDWPYDDADDVAVIRRYVSEAGPTAAERLANELRTLLAAGRTEAELRALFDRVGCSFYPPGAGLTYAGWVRRVLVLLAGGPPPP